MMGKENGSAFICCSHPNEYLIPGGGWVTHTCTRRSEHDHAKRMRGTNNRTSRGTHMQPCRKTGRHANSQSEAGGRAGRLCTQRPRAAPDIAAPLNSIMTVSPTSHRPAYVRRERLRRARERLLLLRSIRRDARRRPQTLNLPGSNGTCTSMFTSSV